MDQCSCAPDGDRGCSERVTRPCSSCTSFNTLKSNLASKWKSCTTETLKSFDRMFVGLRGIAAITARVKHGQNSLIKAQEWDSFTAAKAIFNYEWKPNLSQQTTVVCPLNLCPVNTETCLRNTSKHYEKSQFGSLNFCKHHVLVKPCLCTLILLFIYILYIFTWEILLKRQLYFQLRFRYLSGGRRKVRVTVHCHSNCCKEQLALASLNVLFTVSLSI